MNWSCWMVTHTDIQECDMRGEGAPCDVNGIPAVPIILPHPLAAWPPIGTVVRLVLFINLVTSSHINLTHPITTHADCKSTNLISSQVLSVRLFILEKPAVPSLTAWMFTVSLPQSQTQIYQLPSTHKPTRSPFRIAGLSCHTQTSWLCPWPHLPPIWNCIPTCPSLV